MQQRAKDEDLKRLLPCPFCGGGISEFHDNGRVWTGMKYKQIKAAKAKERRT